ncbi:hypothetical protein RHMOL_Rhmol03G0019400 [Rhododendron molle]|uniref:Uncharacterized protein n=1 Tax=Rhododendron molle TaxID=49168 RepID=A0ACC0PBZ8_RHOML|nr:hypothetical protein RHMOL_Rhmol03G0019400 [Rhododendron molle]
MRHQKTDLYRKTNGSFIGTGIRDDIVVVSVEQLERSFHRAEQGRRLEGGGFVGWEFENGAAKGSQAGLLKHEEIKRSGAGGRSDPYLYMVMLQLRRFI